MVVYVLLVMGGHVSWSSHVTAGEHLLVHVSPSCKVVRGLLLMLVSRSAGEGGKWWCVKARRRRCGTWGPMLWGMVKVRVCWIRKVVGVGLGIGGTWSDCGGRRGRGSQVGRARARAGRPGGRRCAVEARSGKRCRG